MQIRKWQGEALAWSVVLGWHLLVAWWLLHAVRLPGDDSLALHVVYISLPPLPDVPPAQQPTAHPQQAAATATPRSPPPMKVVPIEARTPVSASVLQQARAYAAAAAPVVFAAPDPLGDRSPPLPPVGAERFRVRTQVTPALVLAEIGKLVGGPGYIADPCPRNRRNLDRLLAQGDSERLRIAIEYDRTYCRP